MREGERLGENEGEGEREREGERNGWVTRRDAEEGRREEMRRRAEEERASRKSEVSREHRADATRYEAFQLPASSRFVETDLLVPVVGLDALPLLGGRQTLDGLARHRRFRGGRLPRRRRTKGRGRRGDGGEGRRRGRVGREVVAERRRAGGRERERHHDAGRWVDAGSRKASRVANESPDLTRKIVRSRRGERARASGTEGCPSSPRLRHRSRRRATERCL